ncbi:MAG: hypothetical protein U9O86_07310 [Campylobacterota bacterium]|nr:hypothetical protein [Campylobacterota bacterium]
MNNLEIEIKNKVEDIIKLGSSYSNSNSDEILSLDKLVINTSELSKTIISIGDIRYQLLKSTERWKVNRESKRYNILSNYTLDELKNILKGIIVHETFEQRGGSVTATVGLYFEIASRNYERAKTIELWAKNSFRFDNDYFPYGERSKISFYLFMYKYSNDTKIANRMKVKLQVAGYIKFD